MGVHRFGPAFPVVSRYPTPVSKRKPYVCPSAHAPTDTPFHRGPSRPSGPCPAGSDPGAAPRSTVLLLGWDPGVRSAPRSFQKTTLLPHEVMKLPRCSPLWRQGAAEDSASLWDWSQYGGFSHTFQSFHTEYKYEKCYSHQAKFTIDLTARFSKC